MIERSEGFLGVSDGERIWYETAGSGPELVLCHGLGGNTAVWYQQVPHFAERYRVISWDQRGFGRSSNDSGRVGPGRAVDDLCALLDHLGVSRAAVVGQSMGGWAALGSALREPRRVAALVLTSTTAGLPPAAEAPPDPSVVAAPRGVRPLGEHPAIGTRLPRVDPARAYLYQTLSTFGHRPGDGEFARLLGECTYPVTEVARLLTPTLLICGGRDPLMTPARVRDAATRLPRATVHEFAELGHSAYFEDPESWNAVVAEFLDTAYQQAPRAVGDS